MFFVANLKRESLELETTIVSLEEKKDVDNKLNFFYNNLDCQTIDVVPLNESLAIICDDEGLLISDNPVFVIIDKNGNKREIAGKFMIAKNQLTDEGMDTVGFDSLNEIISAIESLNIGLLGVTK